MDSENKKKNMGNTEKKFVNQLLEGEKIITFFFVEDKRTGSTRLGKPYLDLVLRDRTGRVTAKVWEKAEKLGEEFNKGDYIKIEAMVETYRDSPQLKIMRLRKALLTEINNEDYIPKSETDPEDLMDNARTMIDTVKNPHLKGLLESFFYDEEFAEKLKTIPAAKTIHHTYMGGLLDHSLSVARICDFLCKLYIDLDRDLMITGAIFHDIGKMREIHGKVGFDYTDQGELMGHSVLGLMILKEKIDTIKDFPPKLATLLYHLIISHQGEPEWGAIRKPMFKEAILLHFADNIDAKMNLARNLTDPQEGKEEPIWSEWSKYLERRLLNKEAYLKTPD